MERGDLHPEFAQRVQEVAAAGLGEILRLQFIPDVELYALGAHFGSGFERLFQRLPKLPGRNSDSQWLHG
jgi:hypothetical protein